MQAHLAEKNVEISLEVVTHHLNHFAKLRRVDFFIHRRLGAFLREQLDFFVKSEVVRLNEPYTLKRAMAAKEAGEVVIAFLEKLEDLQKRLWEKNKFSHSVGYIITLDRIAKWDWLIARTGEEVVAREVFDRFKRFADHDSELPMPKLLVQIFTASRLYRRFITDSTIHTGPIDRLGLFGYRTGVQESEVIKPLVLWLLDPEQEKVPDAQFVKALDVVESWMVRRILVRATTKSYNQVVAELISQVRKTKRENAGDIIESFLAGQSVDSRYWPDNAELKEELGALLAYRRLRRGRLRMVLEAVEDHLRGWKNGESALGGERVARGQYVIEHVMPRKWESNWPLDQRGLDEEERNRAIHTLGNLTLLTTRLNSKVSNGPWVGGGGKREGLERHDVLLLNRELLKKVGERWTDDAVQIRTNELIGLIIQIWPVPLNHRSGFDGKTRKRKEIKLADLINAGVLTPGMSLFPRRKEFSHKVVTLLSDGRIEVDGIAYESPSSAASKIIGHTMNGWWFFLTDQASRRTLKIVRREYVDNMAVDAEDDEADDDDDDEI